MQFKHLLHAALAATVANAQSMMNLTALIASNSNLSTLGTLLQGQQQLAASLSNATNVTLFAPSNQAIAAVQQQLTAAAGIPGYVEAVLMYHVVPGIFYASNITTMPAFPHTALNNTMFEQVTGGQVVECALNGKNVTITSGLKMQANVTQANLNFTGGVVHVIDHVLTLPQNVSTTADAANLTALLGAVTATNLSEAINTTPDLTIFAPSNDAFQAIGSATGGLSIEALAGILEYHVINGTVAYSSSLMNGTTVPTLGGKNVTITIDNGTVFVNQARVVVADVLVENGVIHVLDAVLNPNNTKTGNATESAPATAYSGASSATMVPFTSGIPAPSSVMSDLVMTSTAVAAGQASASSAKASSAAAASSSSSAAAAAVMPTGAVGAAALFGAGALVMNL